MIFQTNQLVVKKLEMADLTPFATMQSNPNVLLYTGSKTDTIEESTAQLKELIAAYTQEKPSMQIWAVRQKSDDAFVGTAALVYGESGEHEIGYRFLEKYWGNGFGVETANGLLHYIIETLDLDNVVADVDIRNVASVRILEQSVLTFEKEFFNKEDNCTDRKYRFCK